MTISTLSILFNTTSEIIGNEKTYDQAHIKEINLKPGIEPGFKLFELEHQKVTFLNFSICSFMAISTGSLSMLLAP